MQTLTILQFIEIFLAYLLMTVGLPYFVIRVKISHRRLSEQFLICLVLGNFYIINLVFLLQFMKISNRFTLLFMTLIPACIFFVRIRGIHLLEIAGSIHKTAHRIANGHLGVKTLVGNMCHCLFRWVSSLALAVLKCLKKHWIECILLCGILFLLGWFYGIHLLSTYGYTASDTPVHLWWINGLSDNDVFVDGVYPFGFHCVIYYLHEVFAIDSYVFMRVFGFVQTIMLHLVLLLYIRLTCKSKYIGYAVTGLYILGKFLQPSTYLRFFSVLPQEYGMIFILPAIYFAFQFFREKEKELKKDQKPKESGRQLTFLALSFALTLAVHFYDTMIAGLFIAGVACGYVFFLLKKSYLLPVLATGIISVMLAVAPMAFAFVTGTPLQGSLGWGMSVINGTDDLDKDAGTEDEEVNLVDDYGNVITVFDSNGNAVPISELDDEQLEQLQLQSKEQALSSGTTGSAITGSAVSQTSVLGTSLSDLTQSRKKSLKERAVDTWKLFRETISGALFLEPQPWQDLVVLGAMGGLYLFGILFFFIRTQRHYGAMLLSTGVFMTLMLCLQAAGGLHLPELMDSSRCRIYFAYVLPVLFAMVLDAVFTLVSFRKEWHIARSCLSFSCVVLVVILLSDESIRKTPVESVSLVTNEAITCLTNIIHNEKDFTWTICSANDELQMGVDHGYHYELISFLKEMEYNNMDSKDANPVIHIPTESVFVFIEKVPLDYTVVYENSGQKISTQGAIRDLPNVGGIGMYMGENRWILMSRIYYWAKEFQRKFPNEVKVYCETDRFICYKITQNTYRLYNFAIDYGYNTRKVGVNKE